MTKLGRVMLMATLVLAVGARVEAGPIVAGSLLDTSDKISALEGWLGEGEVQLTRVFEKTQGSTSVDFHAAADLKGRTFTVLEATYYVQSGDGEQKITQLIGGYDPLSWAGSLNAYIVTPSDADRTAFLFNLTSNSVLRQRLASDPAGNMGEAQTFNASTFGPVFGGGFDLWVSGALTNGYVMEWSYGTGPTGTQNLLGNAGFSYFSIDRLEVFTIAANDPTPPAVPEPATLTLLATGLIGASTARRRRS